MKKNILLIVGAVFMSLTMFAQQKVDSKGMRYQAIARDADGIALSNSDMQVKVELFSEENESEVHYGESHDVQSNDYGLINLTIGTGLSLEGDYRTIPWAEQDLWVKISVREEGSSDWAIVSSSELMTVPYAQYAEEAGGLTKYISDALDSDLLYPDNSEFIDSDNHKGSGPGTGIGGPLLYGQTTVFASPDVTGGGGDLDNHPLRVMGADQGIAIQLTAPLPNNDNNFITFFDQGGTARGSIQGETGNERILNPRWLFEYGLTLADNVVKGVNIGLSLIPVVVAGFGASAGPCGACIAIAAADLVLSIANTALYIIDATQNLGVTFSSGSADYAEWLERLDPSELITAGDIVGVMSGKITKLTAGARQYMVISTKPAVLGNMPAEGTESLYEKVAFMGQIPVKVRGVVFAGDYILPSGLNDGTGIAISANDIEPAQYKEIVGVAWSSHVVDTGVTLINMAIGLNSNDVATLAIEQEVRMDRLETRFDHLEQKLIAFENGIDYEEAVEVETVDQTETKIPDDSMLSREELMIKYMPTELSDEVMEDAMAYIEEQFTLQGIDIDTHPGLDKLFNDLEYQNEILEKTKEVYKSNYESILARAK